MQPAVYIMTNKKEGILYTGVTSNLPKRVYEHKISCVKGFSAKYNCHLLVFYMGCPTMESAITEEKRIKAGSRLKKLQMINDFNPTWVDLYESIC